MTDQPAKGRRRLPAKAVLAVAAVVALVLLLLHLQGTIGGRKVGPGEVALVEGRIPAGTRSAAVEQHEVEDVIDWPGTVTSQSVASVAPKVMARVLEIRVNLGSTVKAGDVIAMLDDREIRARAEQARGAVTAAAAQAGQAEADAARARALFARQATTQQDLDAAEARAQSARAQLAQAREALVAAQAMLGETTLRAPFDGVVAERRVDPGDMAVPGQPIVVVQDPRSLRLEAHIPERCARALAVGMEAVAVFDGPARVLAARIEEIAPVADPQTRTFLVKAGLPAGSEVPPGSFGTLRSACGRHLAVLVPVGAIQRVGQLETVRVVVDGGARVRNVQTGKTYGDRVEILSGLRAGETVLAERE